MAHQSHDNGIAGLNVLTDRLDRVGLVHFDADHGPADSETLHHDADAEVDPLRILHHGAVVRGEVRLALRPVDDQRMNGFVFVRRDFDMRGKRSTAQAYDAGKLFHIDLNDQAFGRYDQDFRFGAVNLKSAFFLVKFLEDVGYKGMRHFDAHAYRSEDYEGVKDFARGCMRTYLILKDKAKQWNSDVEIKELVEAINVDNGSTDAFKGAYNPDKAAALKSAELVSIDPHRVM